MAQNSTAQVIQMQTATEVSLRSVARECMQEARWNVDKAKRRLRERVAKDDALAQEAIDSALSQALSIISSQQRGSLCRAAPPGSDNVTALRRSMNKSYLETWLVAGKPLGDASAEQIRESIHHRVAVSKTLQRYNRFEAAILKELNPKTKRVRDVLNDDEVRRLASKHLVQ